MAETIGSVDATVPEVTMAEGHGEPVTDLIHLRMTNDTLLRLGKSVL
jgi:hypothetical protein